jgi:hypothetical protein
LKESLFGRGCAGSPIYPDTPAKNALLELKGCIAPVSIISGIGIAQKSNTAFKITNKNNDDSNDV